MDNRPLFLLKPNGDGSFSNFKEFVSFYSMAYFTFQPPKQEKDVEEILASSQLSRDDVTTLLKWKTGRENKDGVINARKGIKLSEVWGALFPGGEEILSKEEILKHGELDLKSGTKKLIEELLSNKVQGISTVYAITILYVLTNGEYPIYDRFAAAAVHALYDPEACFSKEVKISRSELPPIDQIGKSIPLLFPLDVSSDQKSCLREYAWYVEHVRELSHRLAASLTDRDLDRALWTYGHCFRAKKEQDPKSAST